MGHSRTSASTAVCQQLESRVLLAAPANDLITNATVLPANVSEISVLTTGATRDVGEVLRGTGPAVWYKWTPPQSAVYTFDTHNLESALRDDLSIHVFTAQAKREVGVVASYDLEMPDSFALMRGQTYWIAVDTADKAYYRFSIPLVTHDGPANDLIAHATVLPANATAITGTTTEATRDEGEQLKGVGIAVWYKWTPAQSGVYELDAGTLTSVLTAHVFTGGQMREIETYSTSFQGLAPISVIAGQTYWIAVDTGLAPNDFSISLTPHNRPVNDDFASAATLTTGVAASASIAWATPQAGEATLGIWHEQTLWYRWTAPDTGVYKVQASNADSQSYGSPRSAAYVGSASQPLQRVGGDMRNPGGGSWGTYWVNAVKGKTYYIVVQRTSGTDDVNVLVTPQALAPVAIGTVLAQQDAYGIRLFWEQCDGAVQYDIYRSTSTGFAEATRIATATTNAYIDTSVEPGVLYRYWVQARSNLGTSAMSLPVAARAPLKASGNDLLSHAYVLRGENPAAWYDSRRATTQPDESSVFPDLDAYGQSRGLDRTRWFGWRAPVSGIVNVHSSSPISYSAVRVYTSSTARPTIGDLQSVDASSSTFDATAGTIYWFQTEAVVGAATAPREMISVHTAYSAGDGAVVGQAFASAAPISGTSAELQVYSTQPLAAGEPSLDGKIAASAWWSWTPSRSGYVRIGSAEHPWVMWYEGRPDQYLSVYTGSSVDALTPVVSNLLPSGDPAPMIGFYAVAGTTYRIQAGSSEQFNYQGDVNWILEQHTGIDSNVLVISGTDNADTIDLSGDTICYATVNGEPAVYSLAGVAGVQVQAGRGDDGVTLSGNLRGIQLLGQDGNDTLTGGAGVDTLAGGNGDDSIYAIGDGQRDLLMGEAGTNQYFADPEDVIAPPGKVLIRAARPR